MGLDRFRLFLAPFNALTLPRFFLFFFASRDFAKFSFQNPFLLLMAAINENDVSSQFTEKDRPLANGAIADGLVSRFSEVSFSSGMAQSTTTIIKDSENATKTALTALTLLGVLYANCIGSGYGFEDSIGAAGPLLTAIFCLVVPWIWSLPTGLAVSELATSVRSNSGVLMWVNVSFPPTLSFLCIIGTVFINFVGNAAYPALAVRYFEKMFELGEWGAPLIKVAVMLVTCVLNVSGVEIVGDASVAMSVVTLAPFVIFSTYQLFHGGYSWEAIKHCDFSSVNWATFLSISSWNYSNLDNAGSVAEEVRNPKKSLMRAFVPLMVLTYPSYFFPTLAGASVFGPTQDWSKWHSGYWSDVAEAICGKWLKYFLFIGAIVTSFGYSMTGLCCTSRLLAGIGRMEVLPHFFSKILGRYNQRTGTPVNAILINTVVTTAVALSLSFGQVVALNQALYCLRLVLVYVSVIRLRVLHPTLPRPFAIPLGTRGTVAFLLPAIIFSLIVAGCSATQSLGVGLAAIGFIVIGTGFSYLYVAFFRPHGFQGAILRLVETSSASDQDDAEHSD